MQNPLSSVKAKKESLKIYNSVTDVPVEENRDTEISINGNTIETPPIASSPTPRLTNSVSTILYSASNNSAQKVTVDMLPILNLLGVTQDILPFAKEYFAVVLAGNVFSTGFSSICNEIISKYR